MNEKCCLSLVAHLFPHVFGNELTLLRIGVMTMGTSLMVTAVGVWAHALCCCCRRSFHGMSRLDLCLSLFLSWVASQSSFYWDGYRSFWYTIFRDEDERPFDLLLRREEDIDLLSRREEATSSCRSADFRDEEERPIDLLLRREEEFDLLMRREERMSSCWSADFRDEEERPVDLLSRREELWLLRDDDVFFEVSRFFLVL